MRLFTGIALPRAASAALMAVVERHLLRLGPGAKVKWTREDKLHLTTKFIGEWPESRLDELQRTLRAVTSSEPIDVVIRRLGWMPSSRFALTLHAGVEPTVPLIALAAATDTVLAGIRVAKESRTYFPHITLGRRRGPKAPSFPLEEADDIATFRADSFHLYMSGGDQYTKLSTFPLPTS